MVVYRLGKNKWAGDLSGEGSRLHGGRWNHPGIPCIYTSESRALAVLEYTVNTNIDDVPRALSITTIEIPDDAIMVHPISSLPGNWQEYPAPSSTKDYGSGVLKGNAYPIIRFPSTIIYWEFNYVLNPLHSQSAKFKIIDVEDFIYDVRIKKV